jgi:cold-inducible RNA-binding protein
VGNLSFQTTPQQLTQFLSPAGNVLSVHLPSDRETGRPRGFAFVEFSTEAEAADAIRLFNDRDLDGRKLRINAADDRPPRTGGPGSFSGGFRAEGGGGPPPTKRPFRSKGSRRGIRGRKRSL